MNFQKSVRDSSRSFRLSYLSIIRRQPIEALLNYVIAVKVLNQFYNLMGQSTDDGGDLLRGADEFDHFLEGPCAVTVECNLDHLRGGIVDQHRTLFIIGEFQQLLA